MMPVIRAAAADVRTAAQRLVYKFAMPYAAILPEQTDQHTRSEDPLGSARAILSLGSVRASLTASHQRFRGQTAGRASCVWR